MPTSNCYDLDNPVCTPDEKLYREFEKDRDDKWRKNQLRGRRVPIPVADTGSEPAAVVLDTVPADDAANESHDN